MQLVQDQIHCGVLQLDVGGVALPALVESQFVFRSPLACACDFGCNLGRISTLHTRHYGKLGLLRAVSDLRDRKGLCSCCITTAQRLPTRCCRRYCRRGWDVLLYCGCKAKAYARASGPAAAVRMGAVAVQRPMHLLLTSRIMLLTCAAARAYPYLQPYHAGLSELGPGLPLPWQLPCKSPSMFMLHSTGL
jgi:hypothetical protein